MFWALFDQTSSAWVLQAENMDRTIFGIELLPAQINAANPLLVMILIPLFSYVIYPAIEKVWSLTPLRKIGIGFFVAIISFAIPGFIEMRITAGETPNIIWQLLAFLAITAAEVMISITCLEFSYTQAPKKMKSFIMGIYLLSISLGNAFTAAVNFFIENDDGSSKLEGASYYWFFTLMMLLTSVAFIFVARSYKVKNYIQEEAPAQK